MSKMWAAYPGISALSLVGGVQWWGCFLKKKRFFQELRCSPGASLLISKSWVFKCLPVQAWRSLCTKTQGTLWSVTAILLKWAAFVVWQTWKVDSLNLFHGPLPFLWSVLGARGAVSATVSNLSVPVFPSAKTYLLAIMSSAHSTKLETNGNTEFVGQSKDKIPSLPLFSMVPNTSLYECDHFFWKHVKFPFFSP